MKENRDNKIGLLYCLNESYFREICQKLQRYLIGKKSFGFGLNWRGFGQKRYDWKGLE